PFSTLLMITAAFGGYEQIMSVYETAIQEEYRFGTYGDALLILVANEGFNGSIKFSFGHH
ncbi:S-adenosylmethionine:tRNA ribosyltransferase-isomerase, partial [termite gut metagenome]